MCRKALHPFTCLILIPLAIIISTGCDRSTIVSPIEPAVSPTQVFPVASGNDSCSSNRYLWGLWDVRIALDTLEVDITPDRCAAMHFNVLRKLEVSPCSSCLRLEHLRLYPPGFLQADLILRHPFTIGPKLTGFDVRAIFITGADYNFPASGRSVGFGDGIPRMVICDGYTSLFNPTDFPPDLPVPDILKYFPGRYAFGGDLNATLNPYLAYGQESPRRMFSPYDIERRTVVIDLPEGPFDEIEFGYAVDACWAPVDGEITDPITDFPPEANCLEAYKIDVIFNRELSQHTWSGGRFRVEVYDHQGLDTISTVGIEAPALFPSVMPLDFIEETADGAGAYEAYISNELGALPAVYPLLIRIEDRESDPNLGEISAWDVHPINVTRGWAQTWGGSLIDEGLSAAVDSSGNVFVTGQFQDVVDFDPSPFSWVLSSNGGYDVYLSKFDSKGEFEWALAWGGGGADCGNCVSVDSLGNAYVAGKFAQSVDFDPGPGEYWVTSNGSSDAFLCKFDSSGNLLWAKTWGGEWVDECYGLSVSSSNQVYVTGGFTQVVDFDPGLAIEEHQSAGYRDSFFSKFDANGVFLWARTWGGADYDESQEIAVDMSGNAYVTGLFYGTADFDPGPGVVEYTANGTEWWDVFMSKFSSSGDFLWARVWGGTGWESLAGIALDNMSNIFVGGRFHGLVDFDPGPGVDEYNADRESCSYLSRFTSNGDYQWVRVWGFNIQPYGLCVSDDRILLTGFFSPHFSNHTADFDPGPGIDFRTVGGLEDAFLTCLVTDGSYRWTQTWGGKDADDKCRGMAVSGLAGIYVLGWFDSYKEVVVDFDPGDGVEEHASNGASDVFLSMFPSDGEW